MCVMDMEGDMDAADKYCPELKLMTVLSNLEQMIIDVERTMAELRSGGCCKKETIKIDLTGDKWLVGMAGDIIDQISAQSRNGRVIIQRDDQKDE